jgi:hypothetical protein
MSFYTHTQYTNTFLLTIPYYSLYTIHFLFLLLIKKIVHFLLYFFLINTIYIYYTHTQTHTHIFTDCLSLIHSMLYNFNPYTNRKKLYTQ